MGVTEPRSIPIADIQPCSLLEETAATDAAVASGAKRLAKDGLPRPLLLRPSPAAPGSKYELIWGGNWLAAAKRLGWPTITSRIEMLSDQQALVAALREAAARGELTAVGRARGYRRLHEAPFNLSYVKIAAELGLKGPTSVRRLNGLLLQPQAILDLVSQRLLNEGHVRCLVRIRDPRQRVRLAKRAARGAWSISRLGERVGRLSQRSSPRRSSAKGFDYNGFHLLRDGNRILFSGRDFDFSRESPGTYASALKTALEFFIQNHVAEETAAALKEIEKALASPPGANPAPTASLGSAKLARGVDPLAAIKGLEELAKKFGNFEE